MSNSDKFARGYAGMTGQIVLGHGGDEPKKAETSRSKLDDFGLSDDEINKVVQEEEQRSFLLNTLTSNTRVDKNGKVTVSVPDEIKNDVKKALNGLPNKLTADQNNTPANFDPLARLEAHRRTLNSNFEIPDFLPKARIFNVSVTKKDNNTKVAAKVNIALKDKRKKYKGFNWLDLPIYKNFIKISTITIFKPDLGSSVFDNGKLTAFVQRPSTPQVSLSQGSKYMQTPDKTSAGERFEKDLFDEFELRAGSVLSAGRSIRAVRNGKQRMSLHEEMLYEVANAFYETYHKYMGLHHGLSNSPRIASLLNGSDGNLETVLDPSAQSYYNKISLTSDENPLKVEWLENNTKIKIYLFGKDYCTVTCDSIGVGNLGVKNELDALYNGFSNSYLTARLGQSFEIPHSTVREFDLSGTGGSIDFMSHYSFVDIDWFQIEKEVLDTGNSIFSDSSWSSGGFNSIDSSMYSAFSTSASRIISVYRDRKLEKLYSYYFFDGSPHSGPIYNARGDLLTNREPAEGRLYGFRSKQDENTGTLRALYIKKTPNTKVDYIDGVIIGEPSSAAVQYNFGFIFGGTSNGSQLQDRDPEPGSNQRILKDILLRQGVYDGEEGKRRRKIQELQEEYTSRFSSGESGHGTGHRSRDMYYDSYASQFVDPGWNGVFGGSSVSGDAVQDAIDAQELDLSPDYQPAALVSQDYYQAGLDPQTAAQAMFDQRNPEYDL